MVLGGSVEAARGRLGAQAGEAAVGREVAGAALLADAAEAAAKVEEVCKEERRALAEKGVEVRAAGRSEEVEGEERAGVQAEGVLVEAGMAEGTVAQTAGATLGVCLAAMNTAEQMERKQVDERAVGMEEGSSEAVATAVKMVESTEEQKGEESVEACSEE